MKANYYLVALFSFFSLFSLRAQCPPPGFPNPGNNCVQAPILCENLDGYCATINNNNTSQSFPGCPGWTLNNDEWFAFYAGSTSITIQVTPSGCNTTPQGNSGLQGGIYAGCGPPWVAMDLQCSCTTNPFILTANNFVIGQIYWIVMDGCGGSVCDYAIDVLSGSTVGVPPANPGVVTGPATVCQGTNTSYTLPTVTGATTYTWTQTPVLGTFTDPVGNTVSLTWPTPGTTQLCVTTSNACYANPTPSCTTVEVIPTPTATISGSGIVCNGSSTPVPLTVTFTGTGPWTFVYRINGVAQPAITTSDNPYTLNVTQPGTYALQSVSSTTGNCPGTVSGSSTVTQTNLTTTNTVVNAQCGLSNGSINLTPAGGTVPYTFVWSGGQTSEDISNIPAGSYTVTVTSANGCTATSTITVNDNPINFNISGTTQPNTTCTPPSGNGSINVSVAPAGSYTYVWSGGEMTEDLSNLPPGTYTVTVSAGGTCTSSASFTIADDPNEPVLNATPTPSTCDLLNGSINLSVSGGVAPYTFVWSGGELSEDLSNVPAGSYTVTVTGANGCTATTNVNVANNNPPINLSATTQPNTTCLPPTGNGSIDLSVAPAGSYTYVWSNGPQTQDQSNLPPGTYTVTVSGGGSCTNTLDVTIADQPNIPLITPTVTPSTCELPNGSISVSAGSSVPPYTWLWGNGSTGTSLTNLTAGSYDVTVTGSNGCTNSANINVPNNNPTINLSATTQPNTTCLPPTGNGTIDLSVAPAGTYTYTWSNGPVTQDQTNLPPGTYTVTVSAGGACTNILNVTINDQPNVPILTPVVTPSTCDLPNGSASITVSGSTTPYTYLWSNGATTPSISNQIAGPFSVTVTGANGCSSTAGINIPNNNPQINISPVIQVNTTCNGGNGFISLTVTPPGAFTYIWSNGFTGPNPANLPSGTYSVTVSAGGSCTAIADFFVPNEPNQPDLSFAVLDATCGQSNGNVNLTVGPGVPPYTYMWSNGATSQDINGLPADIYIVTVTGANGCSSQEGVIVNDQQVPIGINDNIQPQTSCLINNGSISLTVSPAGSSLVWSTGQTTPTISGLPAGDYTVTVTVGTNCITTETFTVDDNTDYPGIITDITPATCGSSNGSINNDIVGGIPPYTYLWSTGQISQDLNNLLGGDYVLTVTSAVGCSSELFLTVPDNSIPIDIFGYLGDNNSCTFPPNGFIIVEVAPDGPNYTYLWSNNSMVANLNNVAAGDYTVTVSTGLNCSASSTFTILNLTTLPSLSTAGLPATCGQNTGSVDLTVNSGVPPYTYLWSNNATTQDLNNQPPGTYTVTVTGSNNCSATASAAVVNNNVVLEVTGTAVANNSCQNPNGSIDIAVTPTGTYNYIWSNAATTQDVSGLSPGTYSVTVSAGTSCSSTALFTVGDNTASPDIAPIVTPAICSVNNGAIDLTISGGVGPYTFIWSNMATTEDLNAIFPGNYSVTVTGSNGCSADTTLNVANNASTFSLTGVAAPLTNCAQNNGAVNLTVTPAGTYTIVWSNSATTEDIINLPAGDYTVSVTETGDCTATATYTVNDQLSNPQASTTVTAEWCNLLNGAVNLTTFGGTTPYTFLWTGNYQTQDLNNIAAGGYTVTVTDANNCTTTVNASVPGNTVGFSLSGVTTANTSCLLNNGLIDLSVSPADPGNGLQYTYLWTGGDNSQDLGGLNAGDYSVTVSAGGSCTNTSTFTVGDNAGGPQIAASTTAAFCAQNTGALNITVTGGEAPFTYLWSNSVTTEDLNTIPAGSYTVTVSGSNGCSASGTYMVPDNTIIPSLSGQSTGNTLCGASNGSINLSVSPNTLTYTFLWSSGQTTQNIAGLAPGPYTVVVNGGGNCTSTATYTVNNLAQTVNISGSTTNIACFGGNVGAISLLVGGGAMPYTYVWSPAIPGNPPSPSGLTAGTYTVTVSDANACSSTATFAIQQPAGPLNIACSVTNPVTFPGSLDGSAQVNISGGSAPYDLTWMPGNGIQNNAPSGIVPLNNLGTGTYTVVVTDNNGCTTTCTFTVNLLSCETALGTMGTAPLSLCGNGCLTATYNSAGQFLEPGDVLQFILHTGNSNQIINEIARSNQPTFCFDSTSMTYGTTYYVSAAAGNNDGTGNVLISHFCTLVSFGTPIVFHEKPVASVDQPEPITCLQNTVVLTGNPLLFGASYNWFTSNGQIQSTTQNSATVSSEGTYRFIIEVAGCRDTAFAIVNDLRNNPQADITASPDDLLDCTIDQIVLSGLVEGTLSASTVWYDQAGQAYPNGTVLTITTPGTYVFIALDTMSFCTDTASITIQENLVYPPLFVNPPSALNCANPTTVISGGSQFPGINYAWILVQGTDTISVGTGTSFTATQAGTYWLLGVDPVNNCKNALDIEVFADFVAPVAEAGTGYSMPCFGGTGQLNGSGSNAAILNFQWSTNNGSITSGGNTAVPTISLPGTYILVVTNPINSCTDSDDVVVTPESPVAELDLIQPACEGDKGTIAVAELFGAQPPVTYSIDGGQTFSTQSVFTGLLPGVYTVQIVDATGCGTSLQDTIFAPAVFNLSLLPEVLISFGESHQIITTVNIPLSDIDLVQWTPSTGLSCDTCLNPIATPVNSTRYNIRVVSEVGCEERAPILIIVDKEIDIYVPNIFSPDGDGQNDVFMIFANTDQVRIIKQFQVFSRWGEQVLDLNDFFPNDPQFGWDGMHRGDALNPAVFVWYVVVELIDGREILLEGDVTLTR